MIPHIAFSRCYHHGNKNEILCHSAKNPFTPRKVKFIIPCRPYIKLLSDLFPFQISPLNLHT